jgi:hypothetical protein
MMATQTNVLEAIRSSAVQILTMPQPRRGAIMDPGMLFLSWTMGSLNADSAQPKQLPQWIFISLEQS